MRVHTNKPVLINFYAESCQASKTQAPVILEIKEQVGDRVTMLTIDIDKNHSFAEMYEVQTVPTMILFSDGEELWRKNGLVSAHEVLENLHMHMG